MASGGGKPPAAPDPNVIIPLENQYNRFNTSGPFGSQSWSSGGSGGHETLTTTLDPRMSDAVDRAFSAAATPYQKEYVPTGMDQLASALLGKVGGRYGLSGSNLDTNLQHQKPPAGMNPQPPQGMPNMSMQPNPLMGGPQTMPMPNAGSPFGGMSSAMGQMPVSNAAPPGGLAGMGIRMQSPFMPGAAQQMPFMGGG